VRNALIVAALVILGALAQPVARVSSNTREAYRPRVKARSK